MKNLSLIAVAILLTGCVGGAPHLTAEQSQKLSSIRVYKSDSKPDKEYSVIASIESADCSGPGGSRLYGDEGKSIDILLAKAAVLDGDAIVNVSCIPAPFVNNCWAAKKCVGDAVKFK